MLQNSLRRMSNKLGRPCDSYLKLCLTKQQAGEHSF